MRSPWSDTTPAPRAAALEPIERLRDHAHAVEVPVVLVRVAHSPWTDDPAWRDRFLGLPEDRRPQGPVAAEGTWGAEFYGFEPDVRDLVITKHRYSAFSTHRCRWSCERSEPRRW
ncbi:MAG: isochorismatase family protein [Acidimicrobiales bacterium]|nr:isochorismatase family protein [Acidimicrobiales bacterium]